jgi:energy-converting hydrogenase Eha subunit C
MLCNYLYLIHKIHWFKINIFVNRVNELLFLNPRSKFIIIFLTILFFGLICLIVCLRYLPMNYC